MTSETIAWTLVGIAAGAGGALAWHFSQVERAKKALSDQESQIRKAIESELASKFSDASEKEQTASRKLSEAESLRIQAEQSLQSAAQLTPDQAKQLVVEQALASSESEIRETVESRAREALITVMERHASEVTSESSSIVVPLPNEEMKGRLIGREGRNIRSFEQITQVDLIIDDRPEAVTLSCFDPVRREAARLTLINLVLDGRIHPQKIEELFEKAQKEITKVQEEEGRKAAEAAQVTGLNKEILTALGALKFRTSYSQNVLLHSVEVAQFCRLIANELNVNPDSAAKAGLLHDIGKGLDDSWEGPHAKAGMNFLKQWISDEHILNAVGAHHYEIDPLFLESHIVIIADTLSASRPGARRESLENFMKRTADLEDLAMKVHGVERAFAVQSGRELRVMVDPGKVNDAQAKAMATQIAAKVKASVEYSGQVKVVVIRESRFQDVTK